MRSAMAERIAAASRLMGMRRGLRNRRRNTAKPITAKTIRFMLSTVASSAPAKVSPRTRDQENAGHSPCAKVSRVPRQMTRKPQKMMKWCRLPIRLEKRGQRLAGMSTVSMTLRWPKKKESSESTRASTWSVRFSERPARSILVKRLSVQANITRDAVNRTAKTICFSMGIS
jgi:hypothetical protein